MEACTPEVSLIPFYDNAAWCKPISVMSTVLPTSRKRTLKPSMLTERQPPSQKQRLASEHESHLYIGRVRCWAHLTVHSRPHRKACCNAAATWWYQLVLEKYLLVSWCTSFYFQSSTRLSLCGRFGGLFDQTAYELGLERITPGFMGVPLCPPVAACCTAT